MNATLEFALWICCYAGLALVVYAIWEKWRDVHE